MHKPRIVYQAFSSGLFINLDGNFRDCISSEEDFAPLRNDPLFQSLAGLLD